MKRIEALIIGIIASLIAGLILAPHLIPVIWQVYKTELYIGATILIVLGLLYFVWERAVMTKRGFAEAFEVFKPVKKLTPEDFHITNYIPFYIERESDKEIEDLLSQRKYVFITGRPMLGKTRMAYEAAKKLRGFYLLKPLPKEINIQTLKLPFSRKKIILFLDDLEEFVGKFDLDLLIAKLRKKSKDLAVIATCRSGREFDQVFAKKKMENLLTQCRKYKIEPRRLKRSEEENLAAKLEKNLTEIASDGTPGSIAIDLRYMKQRYEQLGDEKCILKCLKLLRAGNIFLLTERFVKHISKTTFGLDTKTTIWDNYIKSLTIRGFIKKFGQLIFIAHDIYLDDRFLDDYLVRDGDLIRLKDNLFQRKDATNLFYLGNAFYYRENREQALECYQKSLKIKPDLAETHNNLGLTLDHLGRYEEAEKEYREALRISPHDDAPHLNLGVLLTKTKRYEEAEKEYKEAIVINPEDVVAHNNLGNLLNKLERYEEAEKEYTEALRINPDDPEAHCNWGSLLCKLERYEEAENEYKVALRIKPDLAEAHNNLGDLLYELKRYEEAEKELKDALRINPNLAAVHFNLGKLFMALGRKEEARKELGVARDFFRKQGREENVKEAVKLLNKL